MSLNIYIRNGMPFPYQTPTSVSIEAIEQDGGSPLEKDLNTLAFLRSWAHREFDPDDLIGKDARNPFLVTQRENEIQKIDDDFDLIRDMLESEWPYAARMLCVG